MIRPRQDRRWPDRIPFGCLVARGALFAAGLIAAGIPAHLAASPDAADPSALTHSLRSCISALGLCHASILPNSGCSLRLDRCTSRLALTLLISVALCGAAAAKRITIGASQTAILVVIAQERGSTGRNGM